MWLLRPCCMYIHTSVTKASWGERSEVIRGMINARNKERFCTYLHVHPERITGYS